jgi:hypothetical protein
MRRGGAHTAAAVNDAHALYYKRGKTGWIKYRENQITGTRQLI